MTSNHREAQFKEEFGTAHAFNVYRRKFVPEISQQTQQVNCYKSVP